MCCASRATNGDATVDMNSNVRALSEQNNAAVFFSASAHMSEIRMHKFSDVHMSTIKMFH